MKNRGDPSQTAIARNFAEMIYQKRPEGIPAIETGFRSRIFPSLSRKISSHATFVDVDALYRNLYSERVFAVRAARLFQVDY